MFEDKIQYTYSFGYDEDEANPLICNEDLFEKKLLTSTTIKSIKIWFGSPPEKNDIKSLLGIQIEYINYLTGEKKNTKYQGVPVEGTNIEIKELNISDGKFLSYFNILFHEYITYIKIGTKDKFIEFGNYEKDKQLGNLEELNSGNNIIINIKGKTGKNGIRTLGCDYMPYDIFFLIRTQDLFRLRLKLKKDKKFREKYKNKKEVDKLSDEMKLILNVCNLAPTPFATLIKYL